MVGKLIQIQNEKGWSNGSVYGSGQNGTDDLAPNWSSLFIRKRNVPLSVVILRLLVPLISVLLLNSQKDLPFSHQFETDVI